MRATRWVRSKLHGVAVVVLPTLQQASFSVVNVARSLALEFAARWGVGWRTIDCFMLIHFVVWLSY